MGLDANGTRYLLYLRLLGVDFTRTAMIGRQRLHLEPSQLRDSFRSLGMPAERETIDRLFAASNGYAEQFLAHLGADDVHSFDKSGYEGATHLHDLNQEIPEAVKQSYSVVLDSGSLEHVFNFPVALANCMEMVRVGGHFVGITPANNFMWHGFYQFSPELFFNVFTGDNGYELLHLIAFEDRPRAPWYRVRRPALPAKRIKSLHRRPVYLLVLARRVAAVRPFRIVPQQTYCLAVWGAAAGDGPALERSRTVEGGRFWRLGVRLTPEPIKQAVKWAIRRRFDARYFRRIRWQHELRRLRLGSETQESRSS